LFSLHLRNAVSEVLALRCCTALFSTGGSSWRSFDCSFPTCFSYRRSRRLGQRGRRCRKDRRVYHCEQAESLRHATHPNRNLTYCARSRGHGESCVHRSNLGAQPQIPCPNLALVGPRLTLAFLSLPRSAPPAELRYLGECPSRTAIYQSWRSGEANPDGHERDCTGAVDGSDIQGAPMRPRQSGTNIQLESHLGLHSAPWPRETVACNRLN
jgi:hypothetical protein